MTYSNQIIDFPLTQIQEVQHYVPYESRWGLEDLDLELNGRIINILHSLNRAKEKQMAGLKRIVFEGKKISIESSLFGKSIIKVVSKNGREKTYECSKKEINSTFSMIIVEIAEKKFKKIQSVVDILSEPFKKNMGPDDIEKISPVARNRFQQTIHPTEGNDLILLKGKHQLFTPKGLKESLRKEYLKVNEKYQWVKEEIEGGASYIIFLRIRLFIDRKNCKVTVIHGNGKIEKRKCDSVKDLEVAVNNFISAEKIRYEHEAMRLEKKLKLLDKKFLEIVLKTPLISSPSLTIKDKGVIQATTDQERFIFISESSNPSPEAHTAIDNYLKEFCLEMLEIPYDAPTFTAAEWLDHLAYYKNKFFSAYQANLDELWIKAPLIRFGNLSIERKNTDEEVSRILVRVIDHSDPSKSVRKTFLEENDADNFIRDLLKGQKKIFLEKLEDVNDQLLHILKGSGNVMSLHYEVKDIKPDKKLLEELIKVDSECRKSIEASKAALGMSLPLL